MQQESPRTWFPGALVTTLVLSIAIGAAGFFIGKGMARFKSDVRTVTVKGLVERDVASDQAVWTLAFRRASALLDDAHTQVAADREAVNTFLRARGFTDAEIEVHPAATVDRHAQDHGGQPLPKLRYVVSGSVAVRSARVDLVRTSAAATDALLKQGVVLEAQEGRANPRYVLAKFNDLRPQLLADATKNARAIAQQFAADSGAGVGAIQSANQGHIQIFGSDGNDESGGYAPTSTPTKRIRVVSTFEFRLE